MLRREAGGAGWYCKGSSLSNRYRVWGLPPGNCEILEPLLCILQHFEPPFQKMIPIHVNMLNKMIAKPVKIYTFLLFLTDFPTFWKLVAVDTFEKKCCVVFKYMEIETKPVINNPEEIHRQWFFGGIFNAEYRRFLLENFSYIFPKSSHIFPIGMINNFPKMSQIASGMQYYCCTGIFWYFIQR